MPPVHRFSKLLTEKKLSPPEQAAQTSLLSATVKKVAERTSNLKTAIQNDEISKRKMVREVGHISSYLKHPPDQMMGKSVGGYLCGRMVAEQKDMVDKACDQITQWKGYDKENNNKRKHAVTVGSRRTSNRFVKPKLPTQPQFDIGVTAAFTGPRHLIKCYLEKVTHKRFRKDFIKQCFQRSLVPVSETQVYRLLSKHGETKDLESIPSEWHQYGRKPIVTLQKLHDMQLSLNRFGGIAWDNVDVELFLENEQKQLLQKQGYFPLPADTKACRQTVTNHKSLIAMTKERIGVRNKMVKKQTHALKQKIPCVLLFVLGCWF